MQIKIVPMLRLIIIGMILPLSLLLSVVQAQLTSEQALPAISMHGEPALKQGFEHFPYVNPDAPKGGEIRYGVIGTFDGLNPFVIRGFRTTARGLFNDTQFGSLVFETLMTRSRDENFSLYGLLAKSIAFSDDRRQITFELNEQARFSDNRPVTADDVIFSFEVLGEHGRPPFINWVERIETIEKLDDLRVRFTLKDNSDREFPFLIAMSMPILPRHAFDQERFERNTLDIPIGSGPYRVAKVEQGNRIVYERNRDYWGRDLPVKRGLDNFDTITIEYFRNSNTLFMAFQRGLIDVFVEDDPTRWQRGYDFAGARHGEITRQEFGKRLPADAYGFVFNTRRDFFENRDVRKALSLAFDFDWLNRNLYQNIYSRIEGYWAGSDLSSVGRPISPLEQQFLGAYVDALDPAVSNGTWPIESGDDAQQQRPQLHQAIQLLQQAGFSIRNSRLYTPDNKPFTFEIMVRSFYENKIALSFQNNLRRLGIDVQISIVDDTQYQQRLRNYDYDMLIARLRGTPSPGNEQWQRWGSLSRDAQGSFNYAGAADPAIDAMIEKMLEVESSEDFTAAVRALDRVLISNYYYIFLYYLPYDPIARWNHIQAPDYTPLFGYNFPAWWYDKTKTSATDIKD